MLFEFSIGNFRSIAERKTLSMEPASISDFPENVIQRDQHVVLSTAVLYGANASGKSNLLRGLGVMKSIILESFNRQSVSEIPYEPFLLSPQTVQEPTLYEVVFLQEGIKYRYGFEADNHLIHAEWLFAAEGKKAEKALFLRIKDEIEVKRHFPEGKDLEEKTRGNALFLSVVDQFNGRIAKSIMRWFIRFNVISGLVHDNYQSITFQMLEDTQSYKLLNDFFRDADLGFDGIRIDKMVVNANEFPVDQQDEKMKQLITEMDGKTVVSLRTEHKVLDENQRLIRKVEFDAKAQESSGTNKLIDLSGPIFYTLKIGGVLVIDELDAKLHPLLTLSIVKLFQNKEINTQGAQLIFAVHDTNILSICNLRRDQIYFVEKNQVGASDLYSLVAYKELGDKKVRKDRSFEKDYLNGRYGAIPYFGDFGKLSEQWLEKQRSTMPN